MMWLELLGSKVRPSRYVQVKQDIKLIKLRALSEGCDVILHHEGLRPRFIRHTSMA